MSATGGTDAGDKHDDGGGAGAGAEASGGRRGARGGRQGPPQNLWAELGASDHEASDSELSDSEHFLAKGAFLLTPSHELSIEKASSICEKMNFKGLFSLTKTATGILFKFSEPEDYQAVYKKGFHKVTGARFYKKVSVNFVVTVLLFLTNNSQFIPWKFIN